MELIEFITEYTVDGKPHGSSIFAENLEEAKKHLEDKKRTEVIVGHVPDKVYVIE